MLAATKHKTVFLTQRGLRHQQQALEAAPPELDFTIRRDPARDELLALLAEAEFLISERSGEIGAELIAAAPNHKRHRLPDHVEERYGLHYALPDEVARQSDVVCSLLPYQGPNAPLNAAFFAQMKPGSYLAHCGSGAVADEPALIAALRSGRLAGAAPDTYTYEPLRPDDPLLELARDPMNNLILTPHVADGGVTTGSRGRSHDYDNIMAMLNGQPLHYQIG